MIRRVLYRTLQLFVLALLVAAFAQALPFDLLAVTIAGDMLTYLEIAAAVWLAAQATRVRCVAAYTRFALQRIIRGARSRARRAVRRITRALPADEDDHRAPAFA